jgi:hypothetical protein
MHLDVSYKVRSGDLQNELHSAEDDKYDDLFGALSRDSLGYEYICLLLRLLTIVLCSTCLHLTAKSLVHPCLLPRRLPV